MRFVAVGFCVVFPLLSACAIEIDPPGEGEGEGEPAGAVVRLEVDPELLELVVGESATIVVVGKQADGDSVDVSNQLTFASDHEDVATVDNGGNVQALRPGEAHLTAAFRKLSISVPVLVTIPTPPSQLSYDDISGLVGGAVNELPGTDFSGAAFVIVPALPLGLVLEVNSGRISGQVDVAVPSTTFAVTATNSAGRITADLHIEIVCDPTQAVPPRAGDLPDQDFVDANGDGIDGLACGPVFVSPSGLDVNSGENDAPVFTLGRALAIAAATVGRDVYVAAGSYAGPLALQQNVSVYGGYDPITWVRAAANDVVISGGNPTLTASELTGTIELQQLQVTGADAFAVSGDAVGVLLSNAGDVSFLNVRIEAGTGHDGADGAAGLAGEDGVVGDSGGGGCENGAGICDECGVPFGGFGSFSIGTNGNGGDGGAAGLASADGVDGDDGEGGALGGLRGFGGTATNSLRDGDAGATGIDGPVGANGAGGAADSDGAGGDFGIDGEGGGGGGGGAGGVFFVCNEFGGAGGGGGSGGTRGEAGSGGTRGGASIALRMSGTTTSTLTSSALIAGVGGVGGGGGSGGAPGLGEKGGSGGSAIASTDEERGGNGGAGGAGGDGGRGGHGGGGGGGSSIALLVEDGATVVVLDSDVRAGTAGDGGAGPGRAGTAGRALDRDDPQGSAP